MDRRDDPPPPWRRATARPAVAASRRDNNTRYVPAFPLPSAQLPPPPPSAALQTELWLLSQQQQQQQPTGVNSPIHTLRNPLPQRGTWEIPPPPSPPPPLLQPPPPPTAPMARTAPSPTAAYLLQSAPPPAHTTIPQARLLVLDLNGTLLHRAKATKNPRAFTPRPGLTPFLDTLFSSATTTLMLWTSMRPATLAAILPSLLPPHHRARLAATWARDTFDLPPDLYNAKTQLYKDLTRVWDSEAIQATHPRAATGGRWDQTNTLLLDDSAEKAAAQPWNLVRVPELTKEGLARERRAEREEESGVLERVCEYLSDAACADDVSRFVRWMPFGMEAAALGAGLDGAWSPVLGRGGVRGDDESSEKKEIRNEDDTDGDGNGDDGGRGKNEDISGEISDSSDEMTEITGAVGGVKLY